MWPSDPLPEGWEGWEHAPRRSPDEWPQPGEAPSPPESEPFFKRIDPGIPLSLYNLPTMEQLEAEVRRRSVGQTITDICLDLGVSPGLCDDGGFWNRVMWTIIDYRGSLPKLQWELRRREKQLEKDDWRYPKLPLPERTREGIRHAMGFLIGEPPVDPFAPDPIAYAFPTASEPPAYPPGADPAASATGPP